MPICTTLTTPYHDQKPGTSGLRKKVTIFKQKHYLENFVQSLFNVTGPFNDKVLVLGGDGRYYNNHAIQVILRIAAANGVKHVKVGLNGLLSTPAVSHLIRKHQAAGGIVLSASHNPGGENGDFGIKYNIANGGPAPTSFTDNVYKQSKTIKQFSYIDSENISLGTTQTIYIEDMQVDIVDPVTDYSDLMETIFDFKKIQSLFSSGFTMCFDAMHAITGPYAKEILENRLGANNGTVINGIPQEDFAGTHPDPNLAHAIELVSKMNSDDNAPSLGAASDGDGDRNMMLGQNFFVNPSDSLAIMTANAHLIPGYKNGITGVARSLPTSCAVDKVAEALDIQCYETPTGWKYFGNLLDDQRITFCGEESFGSGSDHIREKDGLWAVLFWLNLIAVKQESIETITRLHWQKFGRHYYTRHDYEALDSTKAETLIQDLRDTSSTLEGNVIGEYKVQSCDDFSYLDPVDNSETTHQGIRIIFTNLSRIILRLSGTGTEGATLRVYIEMYCDDPTQHSMDTQTALADLIKISLNITNIKTRFGRSEPDVVT